MLKVWGRNNSVNVQKVMWTVAELGLGHERIDVGGKFGGLDTDEYGALNPNRRVPTIEDGDVVLWESNTIVRYLAARYGTGRLWPEDPALRAQADKWMDWQIGAVLPDMHVVFWQLIRTPEQRDRPAIDAAAKRLVPIWQILDEQLARRPFVAGGRLTMGDVPIGAMVHRYLNLPLERPALPNIDGYYARLQEHPAYRDHVMLPVT
jgi:glutathione S-transferase